MGGAVHGADLDLALHFRGVIIIMGFQIFAVPAPRRIKFHHPQIIRV